MRSNSIGAAAAATAAALLLSACAATVGGGAGASGTSPTPSTSPSLVVYPPPGTAAVASNPTPVLPEPSTTHSAVLPVPPCRPSDLGSRYFGGGDGGQTHMGGVVIWNSGPRPCRVAGDVDISATGPGGAPDPKVVRDGALRPVDAYLPPDTPAYRDTAGLDRYLAALLAAPQFNASASCTRFSGPAAFVVSIGSLSFRAQNNDPNAVQNKVLKGCEGRILLDGLEVPTVT